MARNEHGVDLELLMKPFPQACIKQRSGGGGRSFDYVPGHVVKRRLIEATNNNYNLSILSDSKTPTEKPGELLVEVRVALTIPGCGTRDGVGVQIVAARAGEDLIKGALTDAIKNAAVLFGIGLDLYGGDLEKEATTLSKEEATARRNRFIKDARTIYGQRIENAEQAVALFAKLTHEQAFPAPGDDIDVADALYENAFRALDALVHEEGK